MRDDVRCEFPAGYDGTAILERLAQVLDPELDESILDLGFVRSLQAAFRPCRGCAATADELVRGEFCLSDGGGCSACAAGGGGRPQGDHASRRPLCRGRDRGGRQRWAALCGSLSWRGRRKPGGASPDVPAQRVSQPPGAAVARPARRGLLAGGDLRVAARRGGDAGRRDRDPAARPCTGRERVGRDLAALFGAPGRARPRLQPCRSR